MFILNIKNVLGKVGKNYRVMYLTWKFPFRLFERRSFLIWLLILLVLCIYFDWKKCFVDIIWVKSKNGLFDSNNFKLNVTILKLLLIFILSCYSCHVLAFQSHFYFNAMYLLVMWSLKWLKHIIDWDFQFLPNGWGVLW